MKCRGIRACLGARRPCAGWSHQTDMISYSLIWYHILVYLISYATTYIWYHKCKPMKSYVYAIVCWNSDIIFMNLWFHIYDFISYIISPWYHILELWHHIYESMISYVWLHILYHISMISYVGTMTSYLWSYDIMYMSHNNMTSYPISYVNDSLYWNYDIIMQ